MSLSKPAINYLEMEKSVLALWHEFLSGYFDGAAHTLGDSGSVMFPNAALRFQQSEQPQPQDGVGITGVFAGNSNVRRYWDLSDQSPRKRQEWAVIRAQMIFQVRASGVMSDAAKPAAHCQFAADRLFALLANGAATRVLGEKGVHHLRPRPPEPVKDSELHALRMVSCAMTLRCFILSQTQPQP